MHERRNPEQGRAWPDVAEGLEPAARVGGAAAEIGQVGLGVDDISAGGARLLESGEDRVHDRAGLPVHVALALDGAAGVQRGGTGDEDAVTDATRARVRILLLDGAP